MRTHSLVNINRIVKHRELVKGKKVEKPKPIEVGRVEKQKVEKILNKIKVKGVMKYLVCQKRFTTENDTWKKKKNLNNTKKVVAEFERRMNAEIR